MVIKLELSNNIKEIRKSKGITQTELALEAGLSQGRIANYETSNIPISNMTLDVALRIARALGSTIDEVFTSQMIEKED